MAPNSGSLNSSLSVSHLTNHSLISSNNTSSNSTPLDNNKTLQSLLSLYQQSVASRSISSYVPTLIDMLWGSEEELLMRRQREQMNQQRQMNGSGSVASGEEAAHINQQPQSQSQENASSSRPSEAEQHPHQSLRIHPKNPVILHLIISLLKSSLDYIPNSQKSHLMQYLSLQFIYSGNFWLLRDIMELFAESGGKELFDLFERWFLTEACVEEVRTEMSQLLKMAQRRTMNGSLAATPTTPPPSAASHFSSASKHHFPSNIAYNHSMVAYLIQHCIENTAIFTMARDMLAGMLPNRGQNAASSAASIASLLQQSMGSASASVSTPAGASSSSNTRRNTGIFASNMNADQKVILLQFIHHIIKLSYEDERSGGASAADSSPSQHHWGKFYHHFYFLLLDKLNDSQQEVSFAAFSILSELICHNSNYHPHFHQQILPLRLVKHNIMWIHQFLPHYNMLLTRAKCMSLKRQFIAFRPLTYLSLYLMQQQEVDATNARRIESLSSTTNGETNIFGQKDTPLYAASDYDLSSMFQLLKPMLNSIDATTVMEAAHCTLLLSFNPDMVSSELSTCTNNNIDQAVLAYVRLLNRDLPTFTYTNIFKDICALINCVRDKYYVCCKLIEHISKVKENSCRMYVLTCIFRTLIQISVHSKLKFFYDRGSAAASVNSPSSKYDTTELSQFFREPFMRHIWRNPQSESQPTAFEKSIRTEILFCLCREFLSLCAANIGMGGDESSQHFLLTEHAWISVGVEIVENGKDCLLWNISSARNASIGEFCRVLTFLCIETCRSEKMLTSDERKRTQQILRFILDDIDECSTPFGKLVSVCILSNYIELRKLSSTGKETGDAVFELIQSMIRETIDSCVRRKTVSSDDSIRVEVLLYCMMSICLRFPIKLRESETFLEEVLNGGEIHRNNPLYETIQQTFTKLQYANNSSLLQGSGATGSGGAGSMSAEASESPDIQVVFGSAFDHDHSVFQSYNSRDDDRILLDYVKALQTIIDTSANLHNSDPFNVLQSSMSGGTISKLNSNDAFVHNQPRIVQVAYKTEHSTEKYVSRVISYPSDPLVVNASYTFSPHECILKLKISLKNPTPLTLHKLCVEIGVKGAFSPSGATAQSTKIVGTLQSGDTFTFIQEFTLTQFSRCSFMVSVLGSSKSGEQQEESSAADTANAFLMAATEGKRRQDLDLIRIRCIPIEVQMMHLLKKPLLLRHADFLTLWESFQSAHHFRLLISSSLSITETVGRIMQNTPFFCVKSSPNQIKNDMFQICYASRTLFGDFLLLVVFGNRDYSGHVICDCEFRSVSPSIIHALRSDEGTWIEKELLPSVSDDADDEISTVKVLKKDSFSKTQFDIFDNVCTDFNFLDVEKTFQLEKLQRTAFHMKKWEKIRRFQHPG